MTVTDVTAFETIELAREGGVATLVLNRPDKLNAVNRQMHGELRSALKAVAADREIRALVLTGAGRGFCVGQDLAEFGSATGMRVDDLLRSTFNRLVRSLHALDMPVIAAVNGVAAGAGASIALACDLRICAEDASFIQAFVRVGLVPDTGSTWLLPQLVGPARAFEIAATGRTVDAQESLALGVANRVVPTAELRERAHAWATELAAMPTRAIGMTKRAIYRAMHTSLDDALEHEAQLQHAASLTHDHREGVAAFLGKRDPAFLGR